MGFVACQNTNIFFFVLASHTGLSCGGWKNTEVLGWIPQPARRLSKRHGQKISTRSFSARLGACADDMCMICGRM